jgi:cytochrome c-type biogenesis protein CcmE
MKPKHQRLALLAFGIVALGLAVGATLMALRENMVFFLSPTELAAKQVEPTQRMRIGGLVQDGSVVKNGSDVHFVVTDGAQSINVTYRGILPDLFREGQGVVAEGTFQNGIFTAREVLAKHDENYMPPEVVEALKKSGEWQRAGGK